jgi:tetratricopeptide (TPR) repeat protein
MFWKRKIKAGASKSEITRDAASKAISRYGALMEHMGTSFVDASLLPLSKAGMKQALMVGWKNTDDKHMKAMIEIGYLSLSNFQEGIGNKPIDCKLPPDVDPAKTIAIMEPWLKWSKTVRAESDALLVEWYEFIGGPNDGGDSYRLLGDECIRSNDYADAAKWYRLAANAGHSRAQGQLGLMYAIGQGVPKDTTLAVKWARAAAEQNDEFSQTYLGDLYINGRGVPVDHAEGAKWCRLAADKGNVVAQMLLGSLYHNGQGVPRDLVRAYILFSLAARERPNANPEHILQAKSLRDLVATKVTPLEIAGAKAALDLLSEQ